jgi:hypothetical protein
LAYGPEGVGNVIPPCATLQFEVDLLDIAWADPGPETCLSETTGIRKWNRKPETMSSGNFVWQFVSSVSVAASNARQLLGQLLLYFSTQVHRSKLLSYVYVCILFLYNSKWYIVTWLRIFTPCYDTKDVSETFWKVFWTNSTYSINNLIWIFKRNSFRL